MSYTTVLDGLAVRFATVTGLTAATILRYEPKAVQTTPLLYFLLDDFDFKRAGQVKEWTYRILCRLLLNWQDNAGCETELEPFVNAIPLAVEADPHLGGVLTSGYAKVGQGEGTWVVIDSRTYRGIDFTATVLEKT
jgi:hypothetical protein